MGTIQQGVKLVVLTILEVDSLLKLRVAITSFYTLLRVSEAMWGTLEHWLLHAGALGASAYLGSAGP